MNNNRPIEIHKRQLLRATVFCVFVETMVPDRRSIREAFVHQWKVVRRRDSVGTTIIAVQRLTYDLS